jgi:hypothetical protein
MEHPAVAEVGVIGKPDPIIGELVKAFVTLKQGVEPSEQLSLELMGFARTKLGTAAARKEIEFRENLPKNRAGKIMRRLLKAPELGLPGGGYLDAGDERMSTELTTLQAALSVDRDHALHLLHEMVRIRHFEMSLWRSCAT